LRDGLHVAVVGAPNAGKSSLVNALAQREVAIVADSPGTTRDVIEVRLDLKGFPVILSDTAGLRQAVDQVEAEGVRRARARATSADVRILVVDGSAAQDAGIPDAEITVLSKADLLSGQRAELEAPSNSGGLWISAKTGEGIDELIDQLTNLAAQNLGGDSPPLTRARHRYALEEALAALKNALEGGQRGTEIIAEEVRVALRALGRITGRVDLDEVLDVVFKDFCIGK
jgi:tRNA modification GTPase